MTDSPRAWNDGKHSGFYVGRGLEIDKRSQLPREQTKNCPCIYCRPLNHVPRHRAGDRRG